MVFEVHLVPVVLALSARPQLDGRVLREVPLPPGVEAHEAGAVGLWVQQGEQNHSLEPGRLLRITNSTLSMSVGSAGDL